MKNFFYKLIVILWVTLQVLPFGFSQNSTSKDLDFEVNRVYPPLSIDRDKLEAAQTLLDLNKQYKSEWVRTYNAVEISAMVKGIIKKVVSKNDTLSQEQKDLINKADEDTEIAVKVQYIPENTLKQNDSKEINFKFLVEAESPAQYIGGTQALEQYLKENAIREIAEGSYVNYDLSTIKFTIDEEGSVIDAHIFGLFYRSPEQEKLIQLDSFLLGVICEMPNWQPAQFASGKKVKQDFVLTVGNHENCVINTLNIQQGGLAKED